MKIKQITGDYFDLELNEITRPHFEDPHNYTEAIINEFDTEPFKNLITPEDKIFLDIGANVGLFALHVMPYVETIICVEPTPRHLKIMKDLFYDGICEFGWDIGIEDAALNSYTGTARFREEPVNFTMNAISNGPGAYEVYCITLQDLCLKFNLSHVDLCKVDIEGGEFAALTIETIEPVKDIIKKWVIEVHPRTIESLNHFKPIFEACGYKVEFVDFNATLYVHK